MSQKSPDLQRVLSTIANELLVADTWSMRTSAVWRALRLAGLPNEPRKVVGAHTYTVKPSQRFVYVDGWAVPELGGAIYLITTVVPDGQRNTDAAEIVFKRDSERGPLVLRDGKVHLDAGPGASGRKTRVHLNSGMGNETPIKPLKGWLGYSVFGKKVYKSPDGLNNSVQEKPSGFMLFVGGQGFGPYPSAAKAIAAYEAGTFAPGTGGARLNPPDRRIDIFYRSPHGEALPSVTGHYASGSHNKLDWSYYGTTSQHATVKSAVASMKAKMPEYEWRGSFQSRRNGGMAPFGRSNPKTHRVSAKGAPSGAALDYMREVAGASGVEYGRLTANRDTFRELKRAHRAGDSVAAGVAIVAQYLPRANSGMAPFGGDMGFGRTRSNPTDAEKKRALGVLYNGLLAQDLVVGSREGGQRLDVKTEIGRPAFQVTTWSIYKGRPTFEIRSPYSDSIIKTDASASAMADLIREYEERGVRTNGPGAPSMFNNMSDALVGNVPRRNPGWVHHANGSYSLIFKTGPSFAIEPEEDGTYTLISGKYSTKARSLRSTTDLGRYLTLSDAQQAAQTARKTRRNLGDGPPPPPPPVPNPGSKRASVRRNHHLHPGDRVSMGAFIGTVDQQIPGTYDKYKVQWDNGGLDRVEGHKLRKIRENPSFRDYFTAGKRTAAEVASSAAQGPSELIGDIHKHVGKLHAGLKEVGARAKAAADRVAAERKCDDPTPAEAIKILARAHGVKVNPVGPHGYRRNLGDGPPPPPPLALRANRARRNLGDGPPPPPPPVPPLRANIGDGSFPAPLDRTPRGHMRRNGFLGDIVRYPGSKKVQGRSVTETSTYAETLLNRGSHDLAQMERLREEVREQRRHYPDNERLARINDRLDLLIAELLYERKRGARANPASSGETGRLVVSVDVPGKGSIRAYDPRPKNQWYNIYVTPANGVEARYALHTGNVIMGYGPYWGSNEKPPAWVLSALRKGGLDWEAV